MTREIILDVQGISKSYTTYKQSPTFLGSLKNLFSRKPLKIEALRPLSFKVRKGELLGVLGPNGAGKTTTLKILSGLIQASQGRVIACGQFETSKRDYAYLRKIGMVMGQRQQLLNDLSAFDSFQLAKALYEIDNHSFDERLQEFISMLNIQDKIMLPVRKLSLGERMKMEIILSILHMPEILYLDEPTIGLDFQAAKTIRQFLLRLNKEMQITILLTSHYNKDIEELCERVLLINHGELVYDGPLSGVDERIHGQRLIQLIFKNEEELAKFVKNGLTEVKALNIEFQLEQSQNERSLVLVLALKDTQQVLGLLLKKIPPGDLVDLTINEQPIEKMFTQIFNN